MQRYSRGVISHQPPPPFTQEQENEILECCTSNAARHIINSSFQLRSYYYIFATGLQKRPTVKALESFRDQILEMTRGAESLGLKMTSQGELFEVDQALRQIYSKYGKHTISWLKASTRLRRTLEEQIDIDRDLINSTKGEAAGLRCVLYFLSQKTEIGTSRAEDWGLLPIGKAGRRSPKFLRYLSLVCDRNVSSDDVRNAYRSIERRGLLATDLGNAPSEIAYSVTLLPNVW